MVRGIPASHWVCGRKDNGKGYSSFSSRQHGIKHDGEGFPPLVVSVWNETWRDRVNPLSSHLYVKETRRRGFPPSCHVCVERNTTEKGFPPSCRICVERNTTEKGKPPLVTSLVAADNRCPRKRAQSSFSRVVVWWWWQQYLPPSKTSVWARFRGQWLVGYLFNS